MPLGGLGTGTFEVRADGTFCDWQVRVCQALSPTPARPPRMPLRAEVVKCFDVVCIVPYIADVALHKPACLLFVLLLTLLLTMLTLLLTTTG